MLATGLKATDALVMEVEKSALPAEAKYNVLHELKAKQGQFQSAIIASLGVSVEAEIASAWLSTTDGFGAKRGTTVHSASIMYTIDPQDDFQTVNQIMAGVRDLDFC